MDGGYGGSHLGKPGTLLVTLHYKWSCGAELKMQESDMLVDLLKTRIILWGGGVIVYPMPVFFLFEASDVECMQWNLSSLQKIKVVTHVHIHSQNIIIPNIGLSNSIIVSLKLGLIWGFVSAQGLVKTMLTDVYRGLLDVYAETVNTKLKWKRHGMTEWSLLVSFFFLFFFWWLVFQRGLCCNVCSWRPKIARHFTQQYLTRTTCHTRSLSIKWFVYIAQSDQC